MNLDEETKAEEYFENKFDKLVEYRETTFNPIYELEERE